jgi:hypothetical protein
MSTQPNKEFRALCHEHHVEMRLNQDFSNGEGYAGQIPAYACSASDCPIHYSISRGYFILSHNASGNEWDQMPRVKCFLDGAPMYLAEINPDRRAFRLWRCPHCGASQTNEEGLVGLAPMKIQQSGAQP